jgi:hypothetical protein
MAQEKITELTEEQKALLPVYRDRWIEIGTSCEEMDRAAAVVAVKQAYVSAKIKPPPEDMFFFLQSPYRGAICAALLKDDRVKEARALADYGVMPSEIPEIVWSSCYGSQDAGWLSFYAYFDEVLGLKAVQPLDGLMMCAKTIGWWWPFEEAVVVTDRPKEIHFDEQQRLHNESGMAVSYRDGWGFHAWHTTLIPSKFIEKKDEFTRFDILNEENAEYKRILLEICGTERLVEDVDGDNSVRLIHEDTDSLGLPQKLYNIDDPSSDQPIAVVLVQNSTLEPDGRRKPYALCVDNSCRTASEAVASTFGKTPENYKPEVET